MIHEKKVKEMEDEKIDIVIFWNYYSLYRNHHWLIVIAVFVKNSLAIILK